MTDGRPIPIHYAPPLLVRSGGDKAATPAWIYGAAMVAALALAFLILKKK